MNPFINRVQKLEKLSLCSYSCIGYLRRPSTPNFCRYVEITVFMGLISYVLSELWKSRINLSSISPISSKKRISFGDLWMINFRLFFGPPSSKTPNRNIDRIWIDMDRKNNVMPPHFETTVHACLTLRYYRCNQFRSFVSREYNLKNWAYLIFEDRRI